MAKIKYFEIRENRGRVKIGLVFWCVLICGCIYEYMHYAQPLDETLLVYVAGNNALGDAAKASENPKIASLEENKADDNIQALSEFWGYMKKVRLQNEELKRPLSVLAHIIPEEIENKSEPRLEKQIFDETKIEIYDDNKGVVEVIDVAEKKYEASAKEEPKSEAEIVVAEEEALAQEIVDEQEEKEKALVREMEARVQDEMLQIEEAGDEAPVVLLPVAQ